MSRFLFPGMIVLSAIMHGGLVAWIALLGFEPPRPHAPHVGKASIALRASVASRPASAEKEMQQIPAPAQLPIEQAPTPAEFEKVTPAPRPTSLPAIKSDPLVQAPTVLPDVPAVAMMAPRSALVGPLSGPNDNPRPSPTREKPAKSQQPEKSVQSPAKTKKEAKKQEPRSSKKTDVTPKMEPDTQPAAALSLPSPAAQASQGADELPQKSPSNLPPPYPSDALANGREGTVVLRVALDASGRVTAISVYKSSGFASLDEAALSTVQRWSFTPARRFGQPIPFEVRVPVEFSIRRRFPS